MHRRGFTIVELLIVVVVIAILAAITVVAYTGITVQTRDSVVQRDIAEMAKAVELYRVQNNGALPRASGLTTLLSGRGFALDHDAYGALIDNGSLYNVLYCSPPDMDNTFSFIATADSGRTFYLKAGGSVTEYTGTVPSGSEAVCAMAGTPIPDYSGTSRNFILEGGSWKL